MDNIMVRNDTVIIAQQVWDTSNTPLQVIAFGFVVLALTFLVFAQFAYCRCRCCTKTLSNLLHTVLARLACCFMAIYGVLNAVSITENGDNILDIVYSPPFWLSIILISDFIFYFIYVCVLQKNQLKIDGKDVKLRVISSELAEIHIPFKIDPVSYVWLSDDRAQWIKLPVLSSTFNRVAHKNENKRRLSIINMNRRIRSPKREENPYHHQHNESMDIELQTVTDGFNNKNKLKHSLSRSKNKYEAVGQGRVMDNMRDRDRCFGFVVGSIDDSIEIINNDTNDADDCDKPQCGLIMHSRNKWVNELYKMHHIVMKNNISNLYQKI